MPPVVPGHKCCSFCAKSCKCSSDCPSFIFENVNLESTLPCHTLPSIREVTPDDEKSIEKILVDFHENSFTNRTVPSGIATGLTLDVIEEIITLNNLESISISISISSPECLTEILSVYMELPVAKHVFHIIVKHFKEGEAAVEHDDTSSSSDDESDSGKYVFSDYSEGSDDFDDDF